MDVPKRNAGEAYGPPNQNRIVDVSNAAEAKSKEVKHKQKRINKLTAQLHEHDESTVTACTD
jgi:hypothetical protein